MRRNSEMLGQESVVVEENRVKDGIEVIDLTLAKNQSNKRSTAVEIDLIDLTKDDEYSCHFCLTHLSEVWAVTMEKQVEPSRALVSGGNQAFSSLTNRQTYHRCYATGALDACVVRGNGPPGRCGSYFGTRFAPSAVRTIPHAQSPL